MSVPVVMWTDGVRRLILTPADDPTVGTNQWTLERKLPEPDALGVPIWQRMELDWDVFRAICNKVFTG